MYNVAMQIIKFLGSLAFALSLISGLVIILSVSTVLESVHGTPFAQENFYQAHWFDFFLALVWVNIFCATLTRWPFKKKHVGFVITHIGILTLLIGCFGTRVWGREGQLTLFEAEAGNRMLQAGFSLRASLPGGGEKTFNLKVSPLKKPVLLELDKAPFKLELAHVFPHAEESRSLEEAPTLTESNHALHATLSSETLGFKQSVILIEHDPADPKSASKTIGPATFILENTAKGSASQTPKLRLSQSNGKNIELELRDGLTNSDWQEAGLKISGLRYFPKARVEGSRLVNLDSAPHLNPAVEFEITDAAGRGEHHTRFSFFPEFNSLRGGSKNNFFDLNIALVVPASTGSENSGPSIHFLVSQKNEWSYRIHSMKTGESETQPLPLKTPVRTGWMDMVADRARDRPGASQRDEISRRPQRPDGRRHLREEGPHPADPRAAEAAWADAERV